ncbi:ABC transporter substrate-binding protein [Ornithinimicrobium tianjinense]|uniref:Sugar ABC transporter substrate-binding protein n=1 Tax=Ornithinimicrobium tianjinense TaxID=1195761 RepID=A0A917F6Y6_9MICO|nr:extracellular solute-binding protein [Ornithinimicrobium tianjinense]GGF54464.1 sugar ABC transporter substrate-binding protein [Ornithinimicrobium tianjinense]
MKRNLTATVLLVGSLVLTTACSGTGGSSAAKEKEATFPAGGDVSYSKYGDYPQTTTKDVEGPCSWHATSAKDYSGVTLKVISHAVPVLGEPTVLHAKQFSELTGAKVDVVNVPFGELYQKLITPLQAGQPAYDVMFYPSLWIGDMAPYLEPVPQQYLDTAGMKDVTKAFMDVATWDGKVVQYPVDGDRHYLKVRTDLLTDPKNMADYKAETGDDLRVPTTWSEYQQVAEFLTGRKGAQGEAVFGSAEVTKRDDLTFSAFISRAAAYAKHPDAKGGFFFDAETMEPLINTPGWVKALDDFVAIAPSLPPGGTNFGLGDEILSFGGGQAAMSYSWDDAFIQAQQPDSPIRNEVAAAQLPGTDEVWNPETGQWDKQPNQAAYFTWGWTSAVAGSSKNTEAAFDFLCFFSNEANTALDLQIGRFGINPYRNAHFDAAFWEEQGWSAEAATSYVETLADMETNPNRVFDLRVPGVNQYMSSLATGVAAAMAGQKSSQEALDGVAQEWKAITEQVGKDEVQAAYRNVVKLENGEG